MHLLFVIPLYLLFLLVAGIAIFGWAFVRIAYFKTRDWWRKKRRKA